MSNITSIAQRQAKGADPLRAALAAAIEAARKAEAAIGDQAAAIERAEQLVAASEAKVAAAGAAVADARRAHAEQVASALKNSGSVHIPAAMRTARAAETDASDELEAAKAALQKLQTGLEELVAAARWAKNGIFTAVNAVIAPAAEHLLKEARAAKLRAAAHVAALRELMTALTEQHKGADAFDTIDALEAQRQREEPFSGMHKQIQEFLTASLLADREKEAAAGLAAAAAWRSAIAALAQDASTVLPE